MPQPPSLQEVLLPNHPQRFELNDEVHARPTEAMRAPLRLSYVVMLSDGVSREEERRPVVELVQHYDGIPPAFETNHHRVDLGPFRLIWEKHTEFARYTFIASGEQSHPFEAPLITELPDDWLSQLPGKVIVAAHAALVKSKAPSEDHDALSSEFFDGNALIGSSIAGESGRAFTDFRIHRDGFSRFLVKDAGMPPRQAGRMVQRLLEIESYRIMALLALPVARDLGPFISQSEQELAEITTAMTNIREVDEPVLLDRLTRLQAAIESRHSSGQYRFSAAAAYDELVWRRIDELRESRIRGLQTFREFTERRLAPAMNTCRSVATRQEDLSERVARATQLLSTRVEVSSERQNQELLNTMNRRARIQLRLQETIEGLSLIAVTYYMVGLIGFAAKGLQSLGVAIDPDVVMAVSIPLVAVLAALGVRRVRKLVLNSQSSDSP